jgi:tetratricopeptide (TPR) repeat protein
MPQPAHQPHVKDESVRHLVELGYTDPRDVASQQTALRLCLKAEFDRATELISQGRGDDAAALLEKIAADDPEWVTPRQRLAEVHYNAGRWEKAQSELDWLANHGIEHPRLALVAGAIALARRDLQTALEELQYARHVEPNLPSVHTLLGSVFFRLGRWDDAEDAFRQAIQQKPDDARAHDGMAAVCLQHGEYEDAADWSLRALEQDMQLFSAHYRLGVALSHLNRPNEAIATLETSARVDPTRAAPYKWMSTIAASQLNDESSASRYRELGRATIRKHRESR